MSDPTWTVADLWDELERFERELKSANLRPATIDTYVGRTSFFLKWLNGDYHPRGPQIV
jgi:hypothetical protein